MHAESSNSVKIYYRPFERTELIARLNGAVEELRKRLPIKRVVLFGSCAVDRHTAASDVDLLIEYRNPARADAYVTARRALFGVAPVEPHVYSESEAEGIRRTLDRMTARGIAIFGE